MVDSNPLPPATAAALATASQAAPTAITPPTADMAFGSVSALLLLTPASHHLLAHARVLVTQGQYQFAVVFAHAACELHTESELIRLVAARPDKTLGELVLPSEREVKTLANPQIRRIYSALTGDYPAGSKEPKRPCADWWEQWNTSRKDRHNVAHKGAQMTEAQAAAAIDVADRYIKHLTEKVETALIKPQP